MLSSSCARTSGCRFKLPLIFSAPLIQQVLGGGYLSLRVERIRLREHVHHEGRHLLRPVALERGGVARHQNAVIFPERYAGDQRPGRQTPQRWPPAAMSSGAAETWRRCSANRPDARAPVGRADAGANRRRAPRPTNSAGPVPCAWPCATMASKSPLRRARSRCGERPRRSEMRLRSASDSPLSLATTIWLGRAGSSMQMARSSCSWL